MNYLTIAHKWAQVKKEVIEENNRIREILKPIIKEFKEISGQDIVPEYSETPTPLKFYPFWGGFAFTYNVGWTQCPNSNEHWDWRLSETKKILEWLRTLHEEEVKILFREWVNQYYQ